MTSSMAATTRRVWELFNCLDPDPDVRNSSPELAELVGLFDAGLEFTQPAMQPDAQTYGSRDSFFAAWDEWLTVWAEHRSEITSIDERGNRVLVLSHDRFLGRDGVRVEQMGGTILTFTGDRITRIQTFFGHDAARQAFEAPAR